MAWLDGYSKRKKITLTGGSSGAQTDYQLKLPITYDSDMQADFDDLRFTKADGTTLIDGWLESKIDSTSAVVWAEFPTTPANTVEQDYYMYYGNSSASSASNGDNTFDDFISNEEYDWEKYASNPIVGLGGVGAWDEKSVYSMTLPCDISDGSILKQGTSSNEYWLFYTGAGNTANPNHETSIGLAKSTDFKSPVKYSSNPVINRSDVGLGGTGQGVSVFDIKYIGTKYYMFMMAMYSNTDFRISMMESTDLLSWTNLTDVLTSNYKDHCPHVIEDPADDTKLIMYYAYQPSSADAYYRIGRATAAKSSPYTWTYDTTNNPILYVASSHRLYPCVEYDNGTYYMYFGKYVGSNFAVYKTSNTVDTSFSDSSDLIINYGSGGAWDDGYASTPRKYSDGNDDWIYYSGRKSGANVYTGIGIVEWLSSGGSLSEWDATAGDVAVTTDHPHTGTHGAKLTGGATSPALTRNISGKNKIYEIWIYDDGITTTNFQNTIRVYDSSGADPLIGLWMGTSTTHYIYRAEGGSWTSTGVARTNGWHKCTFEVRDTDTRVLFDDSLIFTETGLDEDNLSTLKVLGYSAGVGYADDFIKRKYVANPATYGFGSEEDAPGHPTMRRWGGVPFIPHGTGRRSW